MQTASFLDNVEYNPEKPAIKVMMETETSKEIRIAMRPDQHMKEHKAPFPIAVEVIEGTLLFGVEGKELRLRNGDVIALEANVPHDLTAKSNLIVRLTLSKLDKAERVEKVVE
jgi:quercetin dioxygenase-like cupin family protein